MIAPTPDSRLVDEYAPSPNHGERAGNATVDAIILHYTGLREEAREDWLCEPGSEALRWMCNPEAQVSSHYLVHLDGRIVQLVPETRRAWHAGRGVWKDCTDINSCSIGIEIVNTGHAGGLPPYPQAQIGALIRLCRDIVNRHAIMPERILGHSDIAPERKADPGEHFPWRELHDAGIGHWIEPAPIIPGLLLEIGASGQDVRLLQERLRQYGYGRDITAVYDEATLQTVRAFQRRFRPACVNGIADPSTRLTLEKLIATPPPRVSKSRDRS